MALNLFMNGPLASYLHIVHPRQKLLHWIRVPDDFNFFLRKDSRLILSVNVLGMFQFSLRASLNLKTQWGSEYC